jgi:NADPH:quinone reductase-like Zn-dependent oxidoreductase
VREFFALAANGVLGAVETTVLPLDQAGEAHRRLEEREARGKIVLRVGDASRDPTAVVS